MKAALALGVMTLVACQPKNASQGDSSAQTAVDTLRGTLVLEGSVPYEIAALRTSTGRVVIDSAQPQILRLSQLDLWVRGRRTAPDHFVVEAYRVRTANGARAWDGILRSGPGGLLIELEDGSTHPIRGAPANLAQLSGARIWITENADGSVREYGQL